MDEIRGSQEWLSSQLVMGAACVEGCEAASGRIGEECCDQLVMSAVNTGCVQFMYSLYDKICIVWTVCSCSQEKSKIVSKCLVWLRVGTS